MIESLGLRTQKLKEDYDVQLEETSKIVTENETIHKELKAKELELQSHKNEVKKVLKITNILALHWSSGNSIKDKLMPHKLIESWFDPCNQQKI